MASIYKQPLQRITLPVNVLKELQDLPNNDIKDKNNPALSKILPSLRDLLRVFSGRQAYILIQNSKYNHVINLKEGKQPLNLPIYNLSHKELEILWEYLNSILEKGWIRPSKSLIGILILFTLKSNGTIKLYIDYYSLNKIIIKNYYLLPLVSEILD